jgi:hypothetical protein
MYRSSARKCWPVARKVNVPRVGVRDAGGEHGTKQTGADQRGRSEGHYTLTYEDIFGA